jgi:predicted transcriptional regulator
MSEESLIEATTEELESLNRGLRDFEEGKIHSHETARKIYEKYLSNLEST